MDLNMTSQETQDLKEILENLSSSVHGKDLSQFQITDWDSLSENEKNSLLRKYSLYMNILEHEYYQVGLWIALNISENIEFELNKMWFESISK